MNSIAVPKPPIIMPGTRCPKDVSVVVGHDLRIPEPVTAFTLVERELQAAERECEKGDPERIDGRALRIAGVARRASGTANITPPQACIVVNAWR